MYTESKFIRALLSSAEVNRRETAIVDDNGKRSTSYGELLVLAGRFCSYIQTSGAPQGSFIIVRMPSCMEYVAAEIGIWLSRCVVVPVGDIYPEKRVDAIKSHCDAFMTIDSSVVDYIRNYDPSCGSVPANTDNAFIFYTSGSTGKPKGVLHGFETMDGGVPRRIVPSIPMEGIVYGNSAPFFFAASNLVYDVLIAGGTVHLFSEEMKKDVRLLEKYIAETGITMGYISPAVLKLFHNISNSLKTVITAGERLTGQCSCEGYRLFNLYGMTETIFLTSYETPDREQESVPIGKPLRDIEYAILDDDLNRVEDGQTGELCVKGHFCKGYYKDKEGTEALYRGGWLHTGDLAYVNADGDIQYVNRKDWMVKVNGHRVEPGEVESVLREIEGIVAAVVDGVEDSASGSRYLVAYYMTSDGHRIPDAELRALLREKLPYYMVPRYFCRLESLPLNANGKVDRKALRKIEVSSETAEYSAPSNALEEELCNAFSEILQLKRTGVDDDFFLLGGDSIRVMQLMLKCQNLRLSSTLVYEKGTPRAIAAALSEEKDEERLKAGDAPVPLSSGQAGIFFEAQKHLGEVSYNNPFLFRIGEKLDSGRLATAFESAVNSHPGLLAHIFISDDGVPMMKEDTSFGENVCSIERMSDEEFESRRGLFVKPFNLLSDRLFRIGIIETPSANYIFADFHHIVIDGVSIHIFFGEVDRAYRTGQTEGEEINGYDVALAEVSSRESKAYKEARSWYMENYADMHGISLPAPTRNLGQRSFASCSHVLPVSKMNVEEVCRRKGVTPNVFVTAAFGRLLASYTGETHSDFAAVYNGRKDVSTLNTVAMMVKTLPVHCDFSGGKDIDECLGNLKDQMMGAMANDVYPFSDFAQDKGIGSDVIFAYQDDMFDIGSIGGAALENTGLEFNATGEILSVDVLTEKGRLVLRTEYRSDLYDEGYISTFSECFGNVLLSMMDARKMSEVSLLDQEWKQRIIGISSGPALEIDGNESFPEIFTRCAQNNPDSIAVVDDKGNYTYADLDRISDIMAEKLIGSGVGQGDFVCICSGRRKEFVAATIAVMKAGAAYAPVDPEYPEERKAFMVADSGAKTVIDDSWLSSIDDSASCAKVNRTDDSRPAYMIYTSGSTGTPKGVVIPQRALCAFVRFIASEWRLSSESRISCHSSFSFDASVEDLFPALTVGGSVYIVPEELRKDLSGLHSYIVDNGITGGCYTTQLGVSLLEFYPDLPVDYLVVGGEYLASRPDCSCRFINTYGPTEFTVDAIWAELERGVDYNPIPIGRPVANSSAYIVDRFGGLLPEGISGEICLAGVQIADGYWKREQLTDEKFTSAPFLAEGERIYHTGDLGRYNADGMMEFVGRMDNMVKIRGFRVEMGEIDSTVMKIDGVRSCVTAVRKARGRDSLCTWYIADGDILPEQIKSQIANFLPDYMVPDMVIPVESFNYLPSGKVDTASLPVSVKGLQIKPYRGPESPKEKILVSILESITLIAHISVDEDIIKDCGLSSLQLIKFLYLAEQQGVIFSMSDVYVHRTVAALAQVSRSPFYEFIESDSKDAPVVICVCGYVPNHPYYEDTVKCMRKDWSLLIFDEIFNNIGTRKTTIDELLDYYIPVIRKTMKNRKPAFVMGVCYGADIAFALVNRIRDELGVEWPLMAFDPIYDRNILLGIPEEIKGNEPLVKKYEASDYISASMSKPYYSGKVVFVFPTAHFLRKIEEMPEIGYTEKEFEDYKLHKKENEEKFLAAFPDSVFYFVDGHHYNFVDESRMPNIMKLMHENFD